MNAQIQQFWELNRMYTPLRDQLMDELSDDDLSFSPGGGNPTLGELCRELGETEYAYVQSFKTYKADFSYRSNDDSYLNSVSRLQAWYAQLDEALEAVLETVSDEDVATKQIERDGFSIPIHISLDVFREALLIFYGKVSVYAKAMDKPLTQQWKDWIG